MNSGAAAVNPPSAPGLAAAWRHAGVCELWRRHSDAVNGACLARWLPDEPVGALLKTDLFDEALTDGLHPLLRSRARCVVGIDLASAVVADARGRVPGLLGLSSDVRRLPFADGTFDVVVSISTLDHFGEAGAMVEALDELARVLRPGGELLVTLDNMANPLVALRNLLPAPLLYRLGVVPYPPGVSCGPRRMRRLLAAAGFEVRELRALLHCPRFVAVAAAGAIERRAGSATRLRFSRALMAFERLAGSPTRFVTGHFIAARATRLAALAPG